MLYDILRSSTPISITHMISPKKIKAVVCFGSNIEPRAEYLSKAINAVMNFPGTDLLAAGDVEETKPVGVPEEFSRLNFLNQIAIFETSLSPEEFSRLMHRAEDLLGRKRTVRNGPRTIDIDLIDFGGMKLSTPTLTLPHPRAHEREFVMKPWRKLEKSLL